VGRCDVGSVSTLNCGGGRSSWTSGDRYSVGGEGLRDEEGLEWTGYGDTAPRCGEPWLVSSMVVGANGGGDPA